MANLIQIKRSLTTATAPTLANGELAFTANGDHLFIGSNGASITIAGKFNPGVLTANQALVANGSGYLDAVKTANLTVRSITANGVYSPGAGYLLAVDGGGNTYWLEQGAVSINTAAQYAWTNSHTFSSTITVGNSTVNTYITSSRLTANAITVRDATISSNTTTGAVTIAGGLGVAGRINTGDLAAGNDSVYSSLTGTTLTVANVFATATVNASVLSVGGWVIANNGGVYTSGIVNADIIAVGSFFRANTTQVTATVLSVANAGLNTTTANASVAVNVGANVNLSTSGINVGNSTVNTAITSTSIDTDGTLAVLGATTLSNTLNVVGAANLQSTANVGGTLGVVGATTLSNTLSVTGLTSLNGGINTTTANASSGVNIGANVNLSTSGINVGNSTVNTAITSTSIDTDGTLAVLGATTLSNTVSAAGLASLNAGMNTTTANASVAVNVGANVNIDTGKVTVGNSTVNTAITSSGIDTDGTLAVLGATTLSNTLAAGNTTITGFAYVSGQVNAASLTVNDNFRANTTALNVNVNATFTSNVVLGSDNADQITINGETTGNIVPSANVTYNLGALNDRFNYVYAANVHATRGFFEGTVEIQGDLFVSGNVTTVNVSSLEVVDTLIYLGGNNYTSDLLDIGFIGNYYDGAVQRHAGFVRHAADNEYHMFVGYTAEPDNNVIDVGNTSLGYQQATLNAYLRSGGIFTNATHVAVTANASVNVTIAANTLTLQNALAATDGGTGFDTYTSGDILVANSGNAFSKLALGSDGYVLQSNGTAVVYNTLDGGTF